MARILLGFNSASIAPTAQGVETISADQYQGQLVTTGFSLSADLQLIASYPVLSSAGEPTGWEFIVQNNGVAAAQFPYWIVSE